MQDFLIVTKSYNIPLFLDTGRTFIKAETAEEAANIIRSEHKNPQKLFSLSVYPDARAYLKKQMPLLHWLSKKANIRASGMECSCGHMTRVFDMRAGMDYAVDTHICKGCGKRIEVDMSKV